MSDEAKPYTPIEADELIRIGEQSARDDQPQVSFARLRATSEAALASLRLKNEVDYLRAALRDALMALTALEPRGPDQRLLVADAQERAAYALKWTEHE